MLKYASKELVDQFLSDKEKIEKLITNSKAVVAILESFDDQQLHDALSGTNETYVFTEDRDTLLHHVRNYDALLYFAKQKKVNLNAKNAKGVTPAMKNADIVIDKRW